MKHAATWARSLGTVAAVFIFRFAGLSSSLGDAVDAPYLVWTTGGHTNWFAQTYVTFDGVDAARSGGYIKSNQQSWIETIVTGPGTLSFWWMCSGCSAITNPPGDYLEFYIDGERRDWLTGETYWTYARFDIPGGTHTLRWMYVKGNHPGGCGSDCGYLDQVIFSTNPPIPLAAALDTCGVVWTSGGNTNPTFWSGQTNITFDGIDAAQSGAIADRQESWLACIVSGVTNVSFWWRVSSETNCDYLSFLTNEVLVTSISGETGWRSNWFRLSPGTNTLKWSYKKDDSLLGGQDKAWVDQVRFRPAPTNAVELFGLTLPKRLADGNIQFELQMAEDCTARIQVTTNLEPGSWVTLTTVPGTNPVKRVLDLTATNSAQRFYRAVVP